jgi:hypothetical protein
MYRTELQLCLVTSIFCSSGYSVRIPIHETSSPQRYKASLPRAINKSYSLGCSRVGRIGAGYPGTGFRWIRQLTSCAHSYELPAWIQRRRSGFAISYGG